MATCYRHPDRDTGVSCSNCSRPICTDCMTTTTVGMRCPECAGEKTKVIRPGGVATDTPIATYVIMGLCILAYFGSRSGSQGYEDGVLVGISLGSDGALIGVADGEWWRMITGGFLHGSIIHIGFNMYILYWLGNLLERDLGTARFVGLYVASLLAGSFGALLLTEVDRGTVGASGAVFGLMGAAFILERARGVDPMQSGLGPVILLNLAITFLVPNISIGGHLGGLIGGALIALAWDKLRLRYKPAASALAVCVVVGVVSGVGGVLVAENKADAVLPDQSALISR